MSLHSLRVFAQALRKTMRHNTAGFTLIELLVVVAITALVVGIMISYSKTGENQVTLYVETQKIASAILRAKSLAIATFGRPAQTPGTILCGYGLEIDYANRTYRIFSYEPAVSNCSGINPIHKSARVELPGSVSVLPEAVIWDHTPPDSLWAVLFVPPVPTTLISTNPGGAVSATPGVIHLYTRGRAAKSAITVGLAGQVDF